MLWRNYVHERGLRVHDMWDRLFDRRPVRLLYIAGRGFDVRAQSVLLSLLENLRSQGRQIIGAQMLLVDFHRYELAPDLRELTEENGRALIKAFSEVGDTATISIVSEKEDESRGSVALRRGIERILSAVDGYTDLVLDVSSFPRVVYLGLLTNLLGKLVPDKNGASPLSANGVNFQVLVAEDSDLDSKIQAEDPENDLVLVPGFAGPLHAESAEAWPLVWFPILGEGRVNQLRKVMTLAIPSPAEICPVLPHPSRVPRRADNLLLEFKEALFDVRTIATSNVMYVDESNPFEVYRQLLGAMNRYRDSMAILGGCRLVVTPLASKLITVGAGLACFEIRPAGLGEKYGISLPHAEPRRYNVQRSAVMESVPELSCLVLTGEAYSNSA